MILFKAIIDFKKNKWYREVEPVFTGVSVSYLNEFIVSLITYFYGISVKIGYPSYAVAIIILTILIKVVLFPLSVKQMKSMKSMQMIQPEMQNLQKKYKKDKEKLNKATMELYKEHNVNPAGGCLPLLIQMPILFALFSSLRSYPFEPIEHATFFWINNLTNPDPLYILPVLVAIATFFQSKLTASASGPSGQNMMLLYFMPIMIGYISLKFPAGLCLYWVVFNVMGVLQQIVINRLPDSKKEAA